MNNLALAEMDMVAYGASTQRKRAAGTSTRRRVVSLIVTGVAIAVICVFAGAQDGYTARAGWVTPVAASLSDIPSHDGAYRASIIALPETVELSRSLALTVAIRTAADAPVEGATLALESWMPDEETVSRARSGAVQEVGGGLYRVDGLRFASRGWWNLRLRISTAGFTDSLAFNVVLK